MNNLSSVSKVLNRLPSGLSTTCFPLNSKMPCPFLKRFSSSYVHNYASTLLKNYGSLCPVVSRSINNTGDNGQKNATQEEMKPKATPCPFLSEVPNIIKEVKQEDTIEMIGEEPKLPISPAQTFSYNNFFHQQILKKKEEHSYRIFKKVNRLAGEFPRALEYTRGEQPITVWCSNDYLAMSSHPDVKNAAKKAVDKYGTGAGGTRNIAGNSTLHEQLEKSLAELHQKEAALLFTSCFVANDSTLFTLAKALPGCHIFSDAGNHASMIQGIRNSQVPKHIFRQNDPQHLEQLLQKVDRKIPKIVAFETVHSMNGDISPLEELCDVAHKYGALSFVDEVHAVGLYGRHGAGIGEREHVLHKMDMISGTLGKAFGNMGGYVAANALLIDMVRSYAAGFIFTTSQPPSVLAGALEAIRILSSFEGRELRQKHQDNVRYLKKELTRHGFPVEPSPSHIIPIKIGDPELAMMVCDKLLKERGHYLQAINYPTVARGEEKLRLAPTPYHTKDLMDTLVRDLKGVWMELELSFVRQTKTKCNFCSQPIALEMFEQQIGMSCCSIPNCPQMVAAA